MSMSLASLAVSRGSSIGAVAATLKLDPRLLQQIDMGKRPLSDIIAGAIATILGVRPVDVRSEVSTATSLVNSRFNNPLPPRIGEAFRETLLKIPVPQPIVVPIE